MGNEKTETSDVLHVFLCYRQADGHDVASWLADRIRGKTIPITTTLRDGTKLTRQTTLDVYFDREAPAIGDWRDVWMPKLKLAKAFILICTPQVAEMRPDGDWVHREIDQWIEMRREAPIVIDAVGADAVHLPESVHEKWPYVQRIPCGSAVWKGLSGPRRRKAEDTAIVRITEGIRLSEEGVRFEELERLQKTNQSLRRRFAAICALFVIAAVLGVFVHIAQRKAEHQALVSTIGQMAAVSTDLRERGGSYDASLLLAARAQELAAEGEVDSHEVTQSLLEGIEIAPRHLGGPLPSLAGGSESLSLSAGEKGILLHRVEGKRDGTRSGCTVEVQSPSGQVAIRHWYTPPAGSLTSTRYKPPGHVVGEGPGGLRVWNSSSPDPLIHVPAGGGSLTAMSPNGRWLLTVENGKLGLHDTKSGTHSEVEHPKADTRKILLAAVGPTGQVIFLTNPDPDEGKSDGKKKPKKQRKDQSASVGTLWSWRPGKGSPGKGSPDKVVQPFALAAAKIPRGARCEFSPGGDWFALSYTIRGRIPAAGDQEALLQVWPVPKPERPNRFKADLGWLRKPVVALEPSTFSRQDRIEFTFGEGSTRHFIALFASQGPLEVFDLKTRKSHTLGNARAAANRGTFAKTTRRIVCVHADRSVRVWNLDTRSELLRIADGSEFVAGCFASESPPVILTATRAGRLDTWTLSPGNRVFPASKKAPRLVVAPDGSRAAFLVNERSLARLSADAEGVEIDELSRVIWGNRSDQEAWGAPLLGARHALVVRQRRLVPFAKMTLTDSATGKEQQVEIPPVPAIAGVSLSRDGRIVLAKSRPERQRVVYIWEDGTATAVRHAQPDGVPREEVVLDPGADYFVRLRPGTGLILIARVHGWKPRVIPLEIETTPRVEDVVMSRGGGYFVFSKAREAWIVDVRRGKATRFDLPERTSVGGLGPDGSIVLVDVDGQLSVRAPDAITVRFAKKKFPARITRVRFNAAGDVLLCCLWGGEVVLQPLRANRRHLALPVSVVARDAWWFGRRDEKILIAGPGGVTVRRLLASELARLAREAATRDLTEEDWATYLPGVAPR